MVVDRAYGVVNIVRGDGFGELAYVRNVSGYPYVQVVVCGIYRTSVNLPVVGAEVSAGSVVYTEIRTGVGVVQIGALRADRMDCGERCCENP